MVGNEMALSDSSARVLVVDDSLVIRKAIEKMLKAEFDIVTANDGEAGWEKLLSDDQVKVIITDIDMPRLDGYALICRIRAASEARVRGVPVIVITGAEDEETKTRALACGATDFIVKPIDPIQLQARTQAHVQFTQTTRKLAETAAALEDQATTDPLTQLSSRRYFLQRGAQDLAHTQRHGHDMSLIRLDVDALKKIYKQYGDDMIDRLLVWLSKLLVKATRSDDTVARISGAEFAVLAPATGRDKAEVLCQRILAAVNQGPFTHERISIPVTVSLGLVTLSVDKRQNLEDLLELAENRLRQAKAEGGNRISTAARNEAQPDMVEELTLSAPEITESSISSLQPEPAELLELSLSDLTPIEENEITLKPIHQDAGIDFPQSTAPKVSLEQSMADLVSVDMALSMLANGEADKIEQWLEGLVPRVLPILEVYNRKHKLGLEPMLTSVKQSLTASR